MSGPGQTGRHPGTQPFARLVVVAPKQGLDVAPDASNNRLMDPVVLALAQLVRDRWEREQRERGHRRASLRVVRVEPK